MTSPLNSRFGFVEFDDPDDAAAAKDNMHESELFGRVIYVRIADSDRAPQGAARASMSLSDENDHVLLTLAASP
jgi:RNA recognition motif-containing protein